MLVIVGFELILWIFWTSNARAILRNVEVSSAAPLETLCFLKSLPRGRVMGSGFMRFDLSKLIERREKTADGKAFSSLDVIAGTVREVTGKQPDGTLKREYRKWKPCKRLARMLAGLDAVKPLCGARTRSGTPCKCRALDGKKRCALHGGKSTGPKTEAGRAAIAAANRARPHVVNSMKTT